MANSTITRAVLNYAWGFEWTRVVTILLSSFFEVPNIYIYIYIYIYLYYIDMVLIVIGSTLRECPGAAFNVLRRQSNWLTSFNVVLEILFQTPRLGPIIKPYWDCPLPTPHSPLSIPINHHHITLDKQQYIDVDTRHHHPCIC